MTFGSNTSRRSTETEERTLQFASPLQYQLVRDNLDAYKRDAFELLLRRYAGDDLKSSGWRHNTEVDGVKTLYGEVENNSWQTTLTTADIPQKAHVVASILLDKEKMSQYDDTVDTINSLEQLDENTELKIVCCKSVFMTTPRDICVVTTYTCEESGRYLIVTRSVNHPNGTQKGYTRAYIYLSGYIITPDPADSNKCHIAMIAHINLSGLVPPFISKYAGQTVPIRMVRAIRDVATKAVDT